jgi:hypothetical protein
MINSDGESAWGYTTTFTGELKYLHCRDCRAWFPAAGECRRYPKAENKNVLGNDGCFEGIPKDEDSNET